MIHLTSSLLKYIEDNPRVWDYYQCYDPYINRCTGGCQGMGYCPFCMAIKNGIDEPSHYSMVRYFIEEYHQER